MALSLSERTDHITQAEIRVMTRECEKMRGVNLAQGVCDLGVPREVVDGTVDAIARGYNSYTRYARSFQAQILATAVDVWDVSDVRGLGTLAGVAAVADHRSLWTAPGAHSILGLHRFEYSDSVQRYGR